MSTENWMTEGIGQSFGEELRKENENVRTYGDPE